MRLPTGVISLDASFLTWSFTLRFWSIEHQEEVDLCGLPASVVLRPLVIIGLANIAGKFPLRTLTLCKDVLFWMYGRRMLLILFYLLAPKTEWTFQLIGYFLVWLFSWMAPPMAGVVGKLFGTRYLATLYGLTMVLY